MARKHTRKHTRKHGRRHTVKVKYGGDATSDADKFCNLLYQGHFIVNSDPSDETNLLLNNVYKDYFTHTESYHGKAPVTKPTDKLLECINTLNTRGQTILYCAYRFLAEKSYHEPPCNDYMKSIDILNQIPNINKIQRSNIKQDNDLPIAGLIWAWLNMNSKYPKMDDEEKDDEEKNNKKICRLNTDMVFNILAKYIDDNNLSFKVNIMNAINALH